MKRQFLTAIALCAVFTAAALAQAADATAKAEQILKQARAAIGDEGKLKNLQSLSASGIQRSTGFNNQQTESELQLDMLLPDKVMRTTSGQFGANTNAYNAGQLWNEFVPAVGMGGGGGFGGGGGGDRVFIAGPGGPGGAPGGFRGGPGNAVVIGGPGGAGGLGADNPMTKYFQQGQRRDLLLIMIGFVLSAPASAQVQYTYLGEAPGPEGTKLDAVNAKNADGLNLVLYFNQETHQLIGLKYKTKQMGRGGRGGPGGPGGAGGQRPSGAGGAPGQTAQGGQSGQTQPGQPAQAGRPGQTQPGQTAQAGQPGQAQPGQPGQRPQMTPEEIERMTKAMMENFEKAPEVDVSWAFSEHKSAGGFNLPHRWTRSQGGTPSEEWEISKFKVNPKLNPDKFVKKEKPAPTP